MLLLMMMTMMKKKNGKENKNELFKRRAQEFHFYVLAFCHQKNHFPLVIRFGYYPFIFFACRFQVPATALSTYRHTQHTAYGTVPAVCCRPSFSAKVNGVPYTLSCNNRKPNTRLRLWCHRVGAKKHMAFGTVTWKHLFQRTHGRHTYTHAYWPVVS